MSVDHDSAWQTLLDAGLVSGAEPPAGKLESPWYVRLMLGVAGWIAALFLLAVRHSTILWITPAFNMRSLPVPVRRAMACCNWKELTQLAWKAG